MRVFITIDTELSLAAYRENIDVKTSLARWIFGNCRDGTFGIAHQMDRLNSYGLKGVFFVDPMPAAVFGMDSLKRVVQPILDRGHEVQLHIHTEWLPYMTPDPVAGRRGRNIGDFSYEDQLALLDCARKLLTAAGAPPPVAFRAGNYGADDNTLRALAKLGMRYDTSFNPCYLGSPCRVSLPADLVEPVQHLGIIEFPISCIADRPGKLRHAQLCALSAWEMRSALRHALHCGQEYFTVVLHSFEMLSRDWQRGNRLIIERFEALCDSLSSAPERTRTIGFNDLKPNEPAASSRPARLPPNLIRTAHRMSEQLVSNLRYSGTRRRPVAAIKVTPLR